MKRQRIDNQFASVSVVMQHNTRRTCDTIRDHQRWSLMVWNSMDGHRLSRWHVKITKNYHTTAAFNAEPDKFLKKLLLATSIHTAWNQLPTLIDGSFNQWYTTAIILLTLALATDSRLCVVIIMCGGTLSVVYRQHIVQRNDANYAGRKWDPITKITKRGAEYELRSTSHFHDTTSPSRSRCPRKNGRQHMIGRVARPRIRIARTTVTEISWIASARCPVYPSSAACDNGSTERSIYPTYRVETQAVDWLSEFNQLTTFPI